MSTNDHISIILSSIKRRRRELGLTQKEAADRCGLLQANYSRLESGRQTPTLETLLVIFDALGLDMDVYRNDTTTYHIMWRDEQVATVELSKDHKKIRYEKLEPDGLFQPFSGDKLDAERFYRFIKGRCYEDNRADLREILDGAGLTANDPYAFIRISHGVTYADDFWIKINGERLTWDEVRVR